MYVRGTPARAVDMGSADLAAGSMIIISRGSICNGLCTWDWGNRNYTTRFWGHVDESYNRYVDPYIIRGGH